MKLSEEVIIREWQIAKNKMVDDSRLKELSYLLDQAYINKSKSSLEALIKEIKEEKNASLYKCEINDIYKMYLSKINLDEAVRFGNYIREKREAAGLTLKYAANEIGCSGSYLSRLEKGERKVPTEEFIAKLAKGLNIPVETVLGFLNTENKN